MSHMVRKKLAWMLCDFIARAGQTTSRDRSVSGAYRQGGRLVNEILFAHGERIEEPGKSADRAFDIVTVRLINEEIILGCDAQARCARRCTRRSPANCTAVTITINNTITVTITVVSKR
jgi:hypothetical protein